MSAGKQEAWELLAPELPPGWRLFDDDSTGLRTVRGWSVRAPSWSSGMYEVSGRHRCRDAAASAAWSHFGITRQRYAEMTAIDRVREAADVKFGEKNVWLNVEHHQDGEAKIYVWSYSPDKIQYLARGTTLCDAAVACLRDLGALEVGDAD